LGETAGFRNAENGSPVSFRRYAMSKNHDAKKEAKKKPTKTLKEKRLEKKAKKTAQ
jgi:hypothetical protein